ncbi:hypothetical protein K3G63_16135 [Hymenobacter sp. HSC-4F20]|uniref:hypothetical protein n=1 Tax=Hymenobacter sp. HSC-4F20 TaxID=2864135 RepID=UPI001C736FED|nr:hypothetical protein [Hymenobacter sp. HSC-4F20]MBX0291982.1 hypothetical protein [Hymenobacter sp. HSC-4F20]
MGDNTPIISLPTTPPTFQEYQLIHQTQQRQRYPELANQQKPATSDPWKRKVQLWLGVLAGAAGYFIWFEPAGGVGYLLVFSVFTALGLLYQWWEYRRAFLQYQRRPQPLGFRVSEAGLAVQWPQGWQRLPWPTLTRVQQVGDWLLLYPGPDFCYYLDLRQVPAPYTAVDVLALIGKQEVSGPAPTFAS